ncbi:hypothetical protein [Hominisplanchenecus sp.]|uniref:hypothetical protein n=1 Tax=Hominisplanchenecus sp. TaxID=3038130 RepID=UPI0039919AC4
MKKIHKKAAALVFAAAMAGLPMGTALGSLGTMTVWAEEAEGAKAPSKHEEMQTNTRGNSCGNYCRTAGSTDYFYHTGRMAGRESDCGYPGRRYKKYRRFFHCKSGSQNF